jgi:hypothetical protein
MCTEFPAAVMFLILTYFCYQFSGVPEARAPQARSVAAIYAVCAVVIFVSVASYSPSTAFGMEGLGFPSTDVLSAKARGFLGRLASRG